MLGAYRGRDLEVTAVTEPAAGDVRELFSFVRSDAAHRAAANQSWAGSGGTLTYIGEWHTHPWGGVVPSSTDLRSWRAEVRASDRAMVFALVVPEEWGLFIVRPRLLWSFCSRLMVVERGEVGLVFGWR